MAFIGRVDCPVDNRSHRRGYVSDLGRMNHSGGSPQDQKLSENSITLRSPAELADALPYLLGYHPDDSVVVVGVHGASGRFGGRIRLGIPQLVGEWADTAGQLADCLLRASETHGSRPQAAIVYLCQEPHGAEPGRTVMERLRPLARELAAACGARGMPVREALCLSAGRYWSYGCADEQCCPSDGTVLDTAGTSAVAAAATYAGIQVRGSLRELTSRITPLGRPRSVRQELALDRASAQLLPRLLTPAGRLEVRDATLRLASRLRHRYLAANSGPSAAAVDAQDDAILADEEAADLIIGLQDRVTRDRAAEWMEGTEAEPALRLWRALSRRCVGGYAEHAAAPLTLAGWVAWSSGDEPSARAAFGRALLADADYAFARLLHSACSRGLDPESLRECLRRQRAGCEGEQRTEGAR